MVEAGCAWPLCYTWPFIVPIWLGTDSLVGGRLKAGGLVDRGWPGLVAMRAGVLVLMSDTPVEIGSGSRGSSELHAFLARSGSEKVTRGALLLLGNTFRSQLVKSVPKLGRSGRGSAERRHLAAGSARFGCTARLACAAGLARPAGLACAARFACAARLAHSPTAVRARRRCRRALRHEDGGGGSSRSSTSSCRR